MTLVVSRRSLDWQICDELMECPAGMTVSVLADELGASPKAISHALYRLEKGGVAGQSSGLSRDGCPGRPRTVWKLLRTKRSAA